MNRILQSLYLALLCHRGIQDVVPSKEDASVIASENLCGQNSLLLASVYLGISVDSDQIDATFGVRGRPVTMLELQDAAERVGFSCVAVRWTEGLDLHPSTVAIVPLKTVGKGPLHYVVVTARKAGTYQVLDFGHAPMYASLGKLQSQWDGFALHLARRPEDLEPLLQLAQSDRRFYGVLIAVLAVAGSFVVVWWSRRAKRKVGVRS